MREEKKTIVICNGETNRARETRDRKNMRDRLSCGTICVYIKIVSSATTDSKLMIFNPQDQLPVFRIEIEGKR